MALFPLHHLHSLHVHKVHRPNVVVLLGSRRTGRCMQHKIAQITSKINELLPQFSKVVSLKNFTPTNKCPPKKQRFVTFLMQGIWSVKVAALLAYTFEFSRISLISTKSLLEWNTISCLSFGTPVVGGCIGSSWLLSKSFYLVGEKREENLPGWRLLS